MNASHLLVLSAIFLNLTNGEERLSWSTKDPTIRKSIYVPDDLPEGKEENRVLPWVFHDSSESKLMELKCMMRGYNASNNPTNYRNAKWSHPGFHASQVDTSATVGKGAEHGVPYRIWTIKLTTSAADAGKKWATCEWQQGDFPLSTDFKFLIYKRLPFSLSGATTVELVYDLCENFEPKDMNQQIEDDIKRQISEHYNMSDSSVAKVQRGRKFTINVTKEKVSNLYSDDAISSSSDFPGHSFFLCVTLNLCLWCSLCSVL